MFCLFGVVVFSVHVHDTESEIMMFIHPACVEEGQQEYEG